MTENKTMTVFENEEFGQITAIDKNGKPWFVGKEIATALGYIKTADAIRKHCKGVSEMDLPSPGGIQTYKIIPESDMYRLTMRSKLESAERFQDWVCEEVLPAIRKTGSYSTPNKKSDAYYEAKAHLDLELFAQEQLGTSSISKLMITHTVYEAHGISTNILPDYVENVRVTFAATDLLKKQNCGISSIAFNKLMILAGMMEVKERASKKSKTGKKTFKSLTKKGLDFGQNDTSKQNPRETQPYYFEDTFHDLFRLINL